jgi:protein-S-isoprenylcysteine O-methyltransferase Ste14
MPPPLLLLLSIGLMFALHAAVPLVTLFVATRWIGLGPLAFGIAINLMADREFHRANTPVKPNLPTTTLVTNGVFGWTRNPMYLGFVFILLGIWMVFGSATPGVVVVMFAALMDGVYVPPEERKLAATFGDAWQAYQRRTRRWV